MEQSCRFQKILIVKISSLGDILHSFHTVSLLKKYCPESEIDWLVNSAHQEAVAYCPYVSKTILFPRKELGKISTFPSTALSLIKELRKKRYDLVIDLQGLLRSAFFSWTANSPIVAGFAKPKEFLATFFYNRRIKICGAKNMHVIEKNIRLVSQLLDVPFEIPEISVPVHIVHSESAKKKLSDKGISDGCGYFCIAPGTRWPSKQWPPEFFAKVANWIIKKNPDIKVVILGSQAEIPLAKTIEQIISPFVPVNMCGLTGIGEIFEIIRNASLLIANDSGPVHIASALGVPTIAMFGPTDPIRSGPYGKIHRVFQPDISCIKCMSEYCKKNGYLCHSAIDPQIVAECAIEKLSNKNRV